MDLKDTNIKSRHTLKFLPKPKWTKETLDYNMDLTVSTQFYTVVVNASWSLVRVFLFLYNIFT